MKTRHENGCRRFFFIIIHETEEVFFRIPQPAKEYMPGSMIKLGDSLYFVFTIRFLGVLQHFFKILGQLRRVRREFYAGSLGVNVLWGKTRKWFSPMCLISKSFVFLVEPAFFIGEVPIRTIFCAS